MSLKVLDVVEVAESLAPLRLAEAWDNVGLLVGHPGDPVQRALLTIDYTPAVAAEARREECQMVLAFHPPIFHALKRITAGSLVYDAVRAGLALYSFHTALDMVEGGTNDLLADVVGMVERRPVRPTAGETGAPVTTGLGRIGSILPTARGALVERIKSGLGLGGVLVAGPMDGMVTKVAVGAGACGDLVDAVVAQGAQLYLTGEMRHHDALKAASQGVTVVCTLHSNSERLVLPVLQRRLAQRLPGVTVLLAKEDRDAFAWT